MKFRMRAIGLAAVLWICEAAFGGVNSWSALGPDTASVLKVVYSKTAPSTVYMASSAGLSSSQDGGATWRTISTPSLNNLEDIAVDPTDSTRVYVVESYAPSLMVSTDGGATLSPVASFPIGLLNAWQVQVSGDGATVCVSAQARIVCSTDRAQTWTQLTPISQDPSARIFTLVMSPTDSNTMYASAATSATASGILVTHDGAHTWQQTFTSTATSLVRGLAIVPGTPNNTLWAARDDGVWFSNDDGTTWSSTGPGLSSGAMAIAISPTSPAVIYAGTAYGRVLASTNGGTTWIEVTGDLNVGEILALAASPTQAATLLVGGQNGVWGSVTGGNNWYEQVGGVHGAYVLSLSADAASDRIYLNVNGSGLYCIANGADTVTPLNNYALQIAGNVNGPVQVSGILAQSGSPGALFASLLSGIARSGDGGNTWSLIPGSSVVRQASLLASAPSAPSVILATPFSGSYRSTDGGNTWSAFSTGLPAGAFFGKLVFASSNPAIAYGSPQSQGPLVNGASPVLNYGVYRSNDSGLTWSPANTGMESGRILDIAVDPTNAQAVYASSDGVGLLKSTDGGASWTTVSTNESGAIAIDPVHTQTVYVSTGTQVERSVDGGGSWEYLQGAAPTVEGPISGLLLVDPNRSNDLLVADQGGVQRMTIEPDIAVQGRGSPSSMTVATATTFSYTVTNNGPYGAGGVQLNLQLPSSAQDIGATSSVGTCSVTGGAVQCQVGVLKNAATATVSLTATASVAGSFQIVASVQADQPDSDTTNNTLTTTATATVTTATAPPPSGSGTSGSTSHGGGGVLTAPWLLGLALLLGLRQALASGAGGRRAARAVTLR
jgi:photosystem II stability/assembly factor-like uncharacterized protein